MHVVTVLRPEAVELALPSIQRPCHIVLILSQFYCCFEHGPHSLLLRTLSSVPHFLHARHKDAHNFVVVPLKRRIPVCCRRFTLFSRNGTLSGLGFGEIRAAEVTWSGLGEGGVRLHGLRIGGLRFGGMIGGGLFGGGSLEGGLAGAAWRGAAWCWAAWRAAALVGASWMGAARRLTRLRAASHRAARGGVFGITDASASVLRCLGGVGSGA